MLRISRLADYATVVLRCLAEHGNDVVPVSEIAQCVRLEPPTVSKVLKSLAQAGLVESFRGTSGGYRLARAAERISVVMIIEAMEGPLGMTDCVAGGACEHIDHCGVSSHWQRISKKVTAALSEMSLADFVQSTRNLPVRRVGHLGTLKSRSERFKRKASRNESPGHIRQIGDE